MQNIQDVSTFYEKPMQDPREILRIWVSTISTRWAAWDQARKEAVAARAR